MLNLKADVQGAAITVELGITDSELVAAKTLILYGDSGLGKSSQLAEVAEYLYRRYKKPVRLVSAEDSSKTIFQPLIMAGMVQALFVTKSVNPTPTMRHLSRGDWHDGTKWHTWDGSACAYIVEGLQSIAEVLHEDCREKGRFLGEQKGNEAVEEGERLNLPGKFSYNFVQLEMIRLLRGFAMIPGIERVLWSGHETKGVEEGTGTQIRGPALVGTAKTGSVSKYCGALLHIDGYSQQTGKGLEAIVEVKRRIWFERHPDPQMPTVQYPAKITIPPRAMRYFRERFPKPYFDSELKDDRLIPSVADFLDAEQYAISRSVEELKVLREQKSKQGG